MRAHLGWLAVLLLASCSFRTDVPGGRDIRCSGDQACPAGYTCRPNIGRCVALADLNRPALAVSEVALTPPSGNLATTFTLSFQINEPLARAPVAYGIELAGEARTFPFACGDCAPGAACSCTFTPDPARAPAEGPLRVWLELVDALGNAPPPLATGAALVDLTPPGLERPATLSLAPPAGTTTPVEALGPGGQAEVCFTVDEPLAGTPAVWAAGPDDAGALGFALESGFPLGLRYCYTAALAGGEADGPRELLADVADPAGNAARLRLLADDGGLVVDATPPQAPALAPDGGLVFRRAPWGELEQPGLPRYGLRSDGPAFSEDGTLLVYEDPGRQREVLRTPVVAGRLDPALALPGPDRAEVYVELVDKAGNRSPGGPRRVRSVEWVATLGRKVPGDTLANPNECHARAVHGPSLLQADDPVTALGAPPEDGGPVWVEGQASWRRRESGAPPFSDTTPGSVALAYDTARGRVEAVLMTLNFPQFWEYDGDWHQPDTRGTSPGARYSPGLSYDQARGRTVLFGGDLGPTRCDTWEWDGVVWRQTVPCQVLEDGGPSTALAPPPRTAPAQAYDARRRRTVILGGADDQGNLLGDAWEYDGQAWRSLGAAGPSPRQGASLAWTSFPDGGAALVLAGGTALQGSQVRDTNETWFGVWDGATYQWTLASGGFGCAADEPDCGHLFLAGDPLGQGLALASTDLITGRLWRWSGSAWLRQGDTLPAEPLLGFVAAPGTADGPGYLAVGQDSASATYAPTSWHCRPDLRCAATHRAGATPGPRADAALAFGPDGGLLFGGAPGSGAALADLWRWDGRDWQGPLAPAGPTPPGRTYGALTWDPALGQFWLVGGATTPDFQAAFGDAWTLDPASGWTARGQIDSSQAYYFPSLVAVPDGGECPGPVLSGDSVPSRRLALEPDGGAALSDLFDQPAGGTLAYDESRGRLVLAGEFGGLAELQPDAGWYIVPGAPILNLPRAFYDRLGQRVLLLGQSPADAAPGEVWVYQGAGVSRLPIADPEGDGAPPDEMNEAAAYDPARAALLVYGGKDSTDAPLGQTWELQQGPYRPAEACQFRFAAAGAAPGAEVRRVRVLTRGGADPGGARLELWAGGVWTPEASCPQGCPATAPEALAYEATDPVLLTALLADRDTLGVAVAGAAPNGSGAGQLVAGPVQAEVHYLLPEAP